MSESTVKLDCCILEFLLILIILFLLILVEIVISFLN